MKTEREYLIKKLVPNQTLKAYYKLMAQDSVFVCLFHAGQKGSLAPYMEAGNDKYDGVCRIFVTKPDAEMYREYVCQNEDLPVLKSDIIDMPISTAYEFYSNLSVGRMKRGGKGILVMGTVSNGSNLINVDVFMDPHRKNLV